MDQQPLPVQTEPKQAGTVTQVKQKLGKPKKSEETKLGWLPDTSFSDRQKALIRKLVAKDLNDDEFNLFIYRCLSLRLDPLKGEVSVHKRKDGQTGEMKMIMVVQRDGYLTIAHRSGQFNGMKTDLIWSDEAKTNAIGAKCQVWNKSAEFPIEVTVYMKEYNTNKQVWAYKPLTMIQKVAESQALRKAFNISGVYSDDELDSWGGTNKAKEIPVSETDDQPINPAQKSIVEQLAKKAGIEVDTSKMSQAEAKLKIAELLKPKK